MAASGWEREERAISMPTPPSLSPLPWERQQTPKKAPLSHCHLSHTALFIPSWVLRAPTQLTPHQALGLAWEQGDTALLAMLMLILRKLTHVPSQMVQTQPSPSPPSLARPSARTQATSLLKTTKAPLLTQARGQSTGLARQAWPLSTNKGEDNEKRKSKLSR